MEDFFSFTEKPKDPLNFKGIKVSIASPEKIQWADQLPKTRSGKIMRRILKLIAAGKVDDLGDTSTLADPTVVESLIRDRVE